MRENLTPYINILSDFGFKYVFGNEENKDAIIKFLNILFEDKLIVTDVKFHDKEILPAEQDGKRIVYDVYCTVPVNRKHSAFFPSHQLSNGKDDKESNHHFVLEMQNIYTPPFEERITYYAAKMVSSQGKAGWNYELDPVFAIAITNFNFGHLSSKLLHDIVLADKEDGDLLTDKLHIYLCSLKEVADRWEDCKTKLEKILFIIKNMDKMDSSSLAYIDGNYTELFDAACSNRLREDQIVAYSQSLEKLRDTEAGIAFAAEKAAEKGRAEGRDLERKQGIKIMLSLGIAPEIIAEKYNISVDEVKMLSNR